MKKIRWNKHAREFVKELDEETKDEIGSLLFSIQCGDRFTEPQSKPMKSIHHNAHELRVKDAKGSYRIIYVLNIGDEILVPHAFTKQTEKTPPHEINLAIKRLQELINETK